MATTNEASKSVTQMKTVAELNQYVKDQQRSRSRLELIWKLGIAFYRGRQYTYYNSAMRKLMQLPTDDNKPRNKRRLVSNQIKPCTNKLVSKLSKTKPVFAATPGNGDPLSIKASRLAEAAAEYWWNSLNCQRKFREALVWGRIAGQGYWLVTFDKEAGEPYSYIMDPEDPSKPLPSEIGASYVNEMKGYGASEEQLKATVKQGDIQITVVSPLNVILDSKATSFDTCQEAVVIMHMSPQEVKTRYGKDCKADSALSEGDLATQLSDLDNQKKALVEVRYLYVVPSATNKTGRIACFTKDEMLMDGPWDFPFEHLPLVKFGAAPIPDSPYDSGEVEDAIPLNKELNKTLSQLVTHKDLTISPKWLVPRGAGMQAMTDSDEQIQYNPTQAGNKPEQLHPANMPNYIEPLLQEIKDRIRECFSLTEPEQGIAPAGLESGIALDMLQEASTDLVAPIVLDNELSLSRCLEMCLKYARKYYTEERFLPITGESGRAQIIAFQGRGIPSNISIYTEAGSSLPRTRAGRMARVMQLKQMGLMEPGQEWKYMDMPDLKGWKQRAMLDEDQADRENDKMKAMQPLNATALQGAQAQVQTGVNPQTQMPFTGPEEAEHFLQTAAFSTNDFDNHNVHYTTHVNFMKSVTYEELDPMIKNVFEIHIAAHMQAIQAATPAQDNIRANVAVHSALGPSATAALLQAAGATGITPEMLTEMPLDTVVFDSMDKPGSNPVTGGAQATKDEAGRSGGGPGGG